MLLNEQPKETKTDLYLYYFILLDTTVGNFCVSNILYVLRDIHSYRVQTKKTDHACMFAERDSESLRSTK